MQAVWERFLNQPPFVSPRLSDSSDEPDANALRLMEQEIRVMVKADFAASTKPFRIPVSMPSNVSRLPNRARNDRF
jgi:hypothetical protein